MLDFGSFERNVPLKEFMPAKSKKRRLEISGPGENKHNDLWKATMPVRHGTCGLMLQKEKQKRREFKVHLSAKKVGKVEPGKQAMNAAAGECSSLSEAGELSFNVQMSPKKALRVATLKKRFADTIFMATHREHLDHSVQSDHLRLQQERERLQRERREENAKLEALIQAAEEASLMEQQHDLMMQRENERKAARIVLEKIEKSVELDDNMGMLDNLKMIGCEYLYYPLDHGYRLVEDMVISDVEEGEILS